MSGGHETSAGEYFINYIMVTQYAVHLKIKIEKCSGGDGCTTK